MRTPQIILNLVVLSALIFGCSKTHTPDAPVLDKPVVSDDTPKAELQPTSTFGIDGVAFFYEGLAFIGTWDGEAPTTITIIDDFEDSSGLVHGAIGEAFLPFEQLPEKFKKMFDIPVVATDGSDVCAAKLLKAEVTLFYHTPFKRVAPDEIEQELRKTKPWIAVEAENDCEEGLIVDQAISVLGDEDIPDAMYQFFGEGTVVDDEQADIYIDRSVEGIGLSSELYLVSVEDMASGCGVREGITTELFIVENQGNGWKKTSVARVFGDDYWTFAVQSKSGLIAMTETGFYHRKTFHPILPFLEPVEPDPDCLIPD